LNVTFLGWLVIPLVSLAIGSYFLWLFQVNRNAEKLLEISKKLETENDISQATAYLQRFLNFRPNDTEALARYGFLIEKSAGDINTRLEAKPVFEKALRLLAVSAADSRDAGNQEKAKEDTALAAEVRRALGDILLEAGDANKEYYAQAQSYFDWLTEEQNTEEGAQPDDPELLLRKGLAHAGQNHFSEARQAFKKVIEIDPGNIKAPIAEAVAMRTHRDPLHEPEEIAKEADALVDAMVEAHPSVESYLARLRYRSTYDNPKGAYKDARAALQLDPDDVSAIIAAAILEFEQGQNIDEARALLGRAIDKEPTRLDTYVVLIELEKRNGRYDAAEAAARIGIENLANNPGQVIELYWSLANILIQAGEKQQAKELINYLRRQAILSVPLLSYLDGRMLMLAGDWEKARDTIEAVLVPIVQMPKVASEAQLDLAACYQQLAIERPADQKENTTKRLANLENAVRTNPNSIRAVAALAQAQSEDDTEDRETKLRRIEETLSKVPGSTAAILVFQARLAASAELRKPPSDRSWEPVDEMLAKAEVIDPDSPQLLETWIQIDVVRNNAKAAEQRLDAAIAARPSQVNPRIARALVAQEQGHLTEALAILEEAERRCGFRRELFLARVEYLARRTSPESRDRLIALESTLAQYPPEANPDELREALATALILVGADDEAKALWNKLSEKYSDQVRYQTQLFDLAFRTEDEATIEKAIARLTKAEGDNGELTLLAKAGLQICRAHKGDTSGLAGAKKELAKIEQKRKDEGRRAWSRVDLMNAAIADSEKNPDAVIDYYKLAIEHGERQVGVVRRLVQLLYEHQRYDEADAQIRTLEMQSGVETASGDLKRIATDIALVTRDPQRALTLAKQAVPADSSDFRDFLWLGQVYMALNEPEQAEKQFEKAVSLGPEAPEPWIGLTAFHFRRNDLAKAEAVLERADRVLPPDIGTITLAQCYQILRRNDKADVLYRRALIAKPDDPATLRAVAGAWLDQDRFGEAEPLLRHVLDPSLQATLDVPWARRQLALTLVSLGGSSRFTEAMQLVDTNLQSTPDSPRDLISKAMVQTSRADLRPNAIETIRRLEKIRVLDPSEELLLCRLLEAENNWPEAHDRLVRLADRYKDRGDVLAPAITSLMRYDIAEAGPWIEHLNRIERDTPRSAILTAEYYRNRGEKDRALKRIRDFVQANPAQASMAVALLDELGDEQAAEAIYQRMARESKTLEEKFGLAMFYGRHGRIREAIDQCATQRATSPERAVLVALNILARDNKANAAEFDRVEGWIQEAEAQKDGKTDPRALRAALLAVRGDVVGARDLYLQVLKANPNDSSALNNLAWLLALTGNAQERAQALSLIERAILSVGPRPTLLDTRAMVHLALRDPDKAERDLNMAIGSQPSPVYLYHLARVQLAKSNRSAAQEALRKAKVSGLEPQLLDPLERPLYGQILAELQVP
jgi:tetratricopeptide (TPR) repeat protein